MSLGEPSRINIPVDREVRSRAFVRGTLVFALLGIAALCAGTETLALLFGFDSALNGERVTGSLYLPWALAWPWGKFLLVSWKGASVAARVHQSLAIAWAVAGAGLVIAFVYARRARDYVIQNAPRTHDYEGSAHWARPLEVGATGLLPPDHWATITSTKHRNKQHARIGAPQEDLEDPQAWRAKPGIYVGEYVDPKTRKRYWLRDTSDRHVGLYAPTRGGKGVGVIIPACLTWNESLVVNDPKGELFALTSWYRKHKMGQNVFKFDPVCLDGSSARINVLDFVRIGTDYEVADAQNIAKMICDPQGLGLDTGNESDHWRKTAYAFLTGVILHVLYAREIPAQKKTLTGIDEFLSNPLKSQTDIFTEMLLYQHDPSCVRGWRELTGAPMQTCPTVAMAARDMLDRPDGERASVMSSVKSYFDLYRDPIVARNISCSDLSFEDLMYHDRPATLYLINNPDNMERVRPLMRLIVNMVLTTFTGTMEFSDEGRPKPKYRHRMLMLMDEFTSTLSKLSIFANAISFVAGYGIKILIVVQDLVQLADVYGDKGAQALTANLHTQILYATNNAETAKQFSMMLGNQTLRQETRSWNNGKASRSESFHGRPLLDSAEIQSLPPTDEIVMVTNHSPIYCKKIVYWKEDVFTARIGKAIAQSDRLPREEQSFYAVLAQLRSASSATPLEAVS